MICFKLNIDPPKATQQQKGFNRVTGVVFEKPTAKQARKLLERELRVFAPSKPLENALRLEVTWYFPIKNKKKWGEYKITRPDLDNLEKMLLDVMTKCKYWNDDSQVVIKTTEKYYCSEEEKGIDIFVEELDD